MSLYANKFPKCIFFEFFLVTLWSDCKISKSIRNRYLIFAAIGKVKRILIADSGSTKTDWVKVTENVSVPFKSEAYSSPGLNPHILDSSEIIKIIEEVRNNTGRKFDMIRFFGAGVGNQQMIEKIEVCLKDIFDCPDIKADSDMEGAAKAVLGNASGIACIMGTGSNSCHYDGEKIDRKTISLGYILDDSGGGVAFGRRLLSDVFKGIAPEDIRNEFQQKYNLSVPEILEYLYSRPAPNKWIASFMPFIILHKEHPYMSDMINSQLGYFIDREFVSYSDKELKQEGIGFVGSVAFLFSNELKTIIDLKGWKLRNIIKKPLEKLSVYYKLKNT